MTIPSILKDLVFEEEGFVDPEFCAMMIDKAESQGFDPATINSAENGIVRAPDIRNNDRVIFDDVDLAETLWAKAKSKFGKPVKNAVAIGLNERFRVYKYVPGQFFDWHQDGYFERSETVRSKFTLLIYLNAEYAGGKTTIADVFSPYSFRDFEILPQTGKALFFYHPLSHRGDPVTDGVKYVLRTDVMFRDDEK